MLSAKKHKGFTLIELLIVVAIIAILAAIAVPNFLEAQTRAKVSRVKADIRSLATAVEAYRVDYNGVPPWNSWATAGPLRLTYNDPGPFWWALTTPVAYITSPIVDAFVRIGSHSDSDHVGDGNLLDPFVQVGTGYLGSPPPSNQGPAPRTHWLASSYGPDNADDTNLSGRYPYTGTACPYDPTNGTVSWGDIYRHSGRPPTNFYCDVNQGNGEQDGFDPWWGQ